MLPPNFNQHFPNLDVLRNMQPRMRPVAPYQPPGGPQAPLMPGMPGVWGGQPPGVNPGPIGPYPVRPIGFPGPQPVQGGPMPSPVGMEGNPQLANLMALRSMMMRPAQQAY